MVALDATVFSIAIFDNAGVPNDYRTGKPIPYARERVERLIEDLERDGESVLIPAPALAEALTSVAEHAERYVEAIEQHSSLKIQPFGKKEAIEIAIRTNAAIKAGDKRDGLKSPWQKVKYDRQIVATAKAQGATHIYTADKDIYEHASLWGLKPVHLADLPTRSAKQEKLIEEEDEPQEPTISAPNPVPGSIAGLAPSEARAEAETSTKEAEAQTQRATAPEGEAKIESPASGKPAGDSSG
jgi:predicted nucleic acid-binding protein